MGLDQDVFKAFNFDHSREIDCYWNKMIDFHGVFWMAYCS